MHNFNLRIEINNMQVKAQAELGETKKGLFGLKFMKNALETKRDLATKQADELLEELLQLKNQDKAKKQDALVKALKGLKKSKSADDSHDENVLQDLAVN